MASERGGVEGRGGIVREEVDRLLEERHGERPPLSAASRLEADLGLSSLDVASLVVRIEERLGDSGPSAVAVSDLRTFGDLLSSLAGAPSSAGSPDDSLMQARARAAARRRTRKSG